MAVEVEARGPQIGVGEGRGRVAELARRLNVGGTGEEATGIDASAGREAEGLCRGRFPYKLPRLTMLV